MVRVAEEVANAAGACGVSGKKLLEAAEELARSDTDAEPRRRAAEQIFAAASMVAKEADASGASGLSDAAQNLTRATCAFLVAASGWGSLPESSTSGRDDGDLPTEPLLGSCQRKNEKMTGDDLEASNQWGKDLNRMRNSAADSDPLQQSASREIKETFHSEKDSSTNLIDRQSTSGRSLKESSLFEKCKEPLNYGLLGGLALLPYLGSELRKTVSPCSPSVFHYIFSSWWICIVVGVVCSSSGRAMCRDIWGLILSVYLQVASRLAMFGITMLVILYSHLELAPTETTGLYILWGIATILHLALWIMDHKNRET
uniref:Uncharacterized protein n=1 Tax=Oryza punctata TaxID=4537 RepID=A0A0E0JS76_ORYPU